MAKKKPNDNFIHNCDSSPVSIASHKTAITHMGYSNDEVLLILDFYLVHGPILKQKSDNSCLKSLQDYGWKGNKDLIALEGKLSSSSGIAHFCFIRSNSINETLEAMNLKDSICVNHPRAVLKQDYKITLHENESVEIESNESRMVCLMRHIRNSLAHSNTYLFNNDFILLEDKETNANTVSAMILIPKAALISWIGIITNR